MHPAARPYLLLTPVLFIATFSYWLRTADREQVPLNIASAHGRVT